MKCLWASKNYWAERLHKMFPDRKYSFDEEKTQSKAVTARSLSLSVIALSAWLKQCPDINLLCQCCHFLLITNRRFRSARTASYGPSCSNTCSDFVTLFTLLLFTQGSETRVDTQKTRRFFLGVYPPKNLAKKPHPKFNPVLFLVLLKTKDFIMFKALENL